MNIGFVGTSHAAQHLSRAAAEKGFKIVPWYDADLVFISEDTPTDGHGRRDLASIRALIETVKLGWMDSTVVVTSAVPPGFMRELHYNIPRFFHQAETLRIKDAEERARRPEMLIVGRRDASVPVPPEYADYLAAFECPVLLMSWEEAEFAKVAINACLAAQVDCTNRLAAAAAKIGADWNVVAEVLRHDARIGRKAYLEPGRWQDSRHLLRDDLTLREILK